MSARNFRRCNIPDTCSERTSCAFSPRDNGGRRSHFFIHQRIIYAVFIFSLVVVVLVVEHLVFQLEWHFSLNRSELVFQDVREKK